MEDRRRSVSELTRPLGPTNPQVTERSTLDKRRHRNRSVSFDRPPPSSECESVRRRQLGLRLGPRTRTGALRYLHTSTSNSNSNTSGNHHTRYSNYNLETQQTASIVVHRQALQHLQLYANSDSERRTRSWEQRSALVGEVRRLGALGLRELELDRVLPLAMAARRARARVRALDVVLHRPLDCNLELGQDVSVGRALHDAREGMGGRERV